MNIDKIYNPVLTLIKLVSRCKQHFREHNTDLKFRCRQKIKILYNTFRDIEIINIKLRKYQQFAKNLFVIASSKVIHILLKRYPVVYTISPETAFKVLRRTHIKNMSRCNYQFVEHQFVRIQLSIQVLVFHFI